jgi:hypothetical protein
VDPITVMVAAAAALGSSALGEVGRRAVGHAWDGVKKAIQQRLGSSSEVPTLIDELRSAPGGSVVGGQVVEQLSAAHLESYPEVIEAIGGLSKALQREGITIAPVNIHAGKIFGAGVNHGTINMNMTLSEDD